jgi:hypothetical protein
MIKLGTPPSSIIGGYIGVDNETTLMLHTLGFFPEYKDVSNRITYFRRSPELESKIKEGRR